METRAIEIMPQDFGSSKGSDETAQQIKVEYMYSHSKKGGNDLVQYNQGPHLTQAITWESNKNTKKHHQQEPRGQPFPSR